MSSSENFLSLSIKLTAFSSACSAVSGAMSLSLS